MQTRIKYQCLMYSSLVCYLWTRFLLNEPCLSYSLIMDEYRGRNVANQEKSQRSRVQTTSAWRDFLSTGAVTSFSRCSIIDVPDLFKNSMEFNEIGFSHEEEQQSFTNAQFER